MQLILVGYRGSGKSTIGRALAERLGYRFADLDDEVCAFFGDKTIKQIWDEFGEPAFRKLECYQLRKLLAEQNIVLALGGGTVMQDQCRRTIETAPKRVAIYLHCDPAELHRRVLADPKFTQTRPNQPCPQTGLGEITAGLAEREPTYRAVADHVIDAGGMTVEQVVELVLAKIA